MRKTQKYWSIRKKWIKLNRKSLMSIIQLTQSIDRNIKNISPELITLYKKKRKTNKK